MAAFDLPTKVQQHQTVQAIVVRAAVPYCGTYLIVAAFVPIAPEVNTWFPLSTKAYASSSIIYDKRLFGRSQKTKACLQQLRKRASNVLSRQNEHTNTYDTLSVSSMRTQRYVLLHEKTNK